MFEPRGARGSRGTAARMCPSPNGPGSLDTTSGRFEHRRFPRSFTKASRLVAIVACRSGRPRAPGAPSLVPRRPDPPVLRASPAESSRVEREWEAKLRAIPEPQRMRAAMERLAARPHHVGSPYDKANAEWVRDQFASYGWQAT